MLLKDITPFVRLALTLQYDQSIKSELEKTVKTRDCRLFFAVSGGGYIETNGNQHPLVPPCVLIIPAGTSYKIVPEQNLKMYIVNFDYTEDFSYIRQSFHPYSEAFPGVLQNIRFTDALLLNFPLYLERSGQFEGQIRRIVRTFHEKSAFCDEYLSAALKSVIIGAVRLSMITRENREYSAQVEAIRKYIQNNYTGDISNDAISAHFHFSPAYMGRIFKRETGLSVHRYLVLYRIDIARELISSSHYSISEIAALVGFSDYPHFSKTFKAITGKTPMQYQEENKH